MILALLVAVAGAAGASCRYVVDGVVQQRWRGPFPMGTFVINTSGSLVLGGIAGFFVEHASAPADVKTVLGTGFVGAFTTFSTLMFESRRLAQSGSGRYAVWNLLSTLVAGLTMACLGVWIGGKL